MEEDIKPEPVEKVIFFDGVCGLCNFFVDFIIKRDHEKKFKFSPLQSDFAKEKLSSDFTSELNTVVFMNGRRFYFFSTAALKILAEMDSSPWRHFKYLIYVPRFIRDFFYRLVAKYRYKIFGERESCRIPSAEEMERFIL